MVNTGGRQALTVPFCSAKLSIWIDSVNKFNSLLLERSVHIWDLGVGKKSCCGGGYVIHANKSTFSMKLTNFLFQLRDVIGTILIICNQLTINV